MLGIPIRWDLFLFQHPWQQHSILHPAWNPPPGEPPHWWRTKEALCCRSLEVLEATQNIRRQKYKFIFRSFTQFRTWSSWWSWGHERPWRDEGRQGKGQGWTKEGRTSKALGMDHLNAILPVSSVFVFFQLFGVFIRLSTICNIFVHRMAHFSRGARSPTGWISFSDQKWSSSCDRHFPIIVPARLNIVFFRPLSLLTMSWWLVACCNCQLLWISEMK